jgi:hypothetical protein
VKVGRLLGGVIVSDELIAAALKQGAGREDVNGRDARRRRRHCVVVAIVAIGSIIELRVQARRPVRHACGETDGQKLTVNVKEEKKEKKTKAQRNG